MATVLVVDDEPDIRMLVRLTLGLDGHEVVEAGSGLEALDVVGRHRPDVVVLDVMMPELSGWDTLQELKHHVDERVREVPVLLLTALSGPMDRAKGGIEGAVRYLAKPIAPELLRSSVAEALGGDPEPVQRRRAQTQALEELARIEAGVPEPAPGAASAQGPRPRLSGLETARTARPPEAASNQGAELLAAVAALTDKQREILDAIRRAPTVLAAAGELRTSRSNVYASLRRIARRLRVRSVAELVDLARAGRLQP